MAMVFPGESTVVQANLKNGEERRHVLERLIPNADVLLESYRPGVMERLGLGPEVVHKINPNLVYVRLTGYG
jgi:alpha-methylacyl-CoA racemase